MRLTDMYESIVQNMSEAVYVRDLDMNILYINPASEKLTGWTLKEASDKKCYEVFGDEFFACKGVCPVEKAISQKAPILHHEGKLRTRKGDVRDVEVSISPLYSRKKIVGAIVVMEDITAMREAEKTNVKTLIAIEKEIEERNMLENELREAELRYHKLFVKSPLGILIISTETAKIIEFNDAACKQLGYSPEEFAKLHIYDFEAVESSAETQEHIKKLLSEGHHTFETMHRTKSGEIRNIIVIAQTIELSGKKFLLSIFYDITERKKAEDELRQTQKELLEKNESLERFNRLAVGREMRMIELKKEVNDLLEKMGEPKRYEAPDGIKE